MPLVPPTSVGGGGGGGQVLISNSVLTGSAASFDLQNIDQGYAHLRLLLTLRSDRASALDEAGLRFNNDSGANYQRQISQANNVTATLNQQNAVTSIDLGAGIAASSTAGYAAFLDVQIIGYAGTTWNKLVLSYLANATGAGASTVTTQLTGGLWNSTAAITRITVFPQVGTNWITGSSCTLYGLAAA